MNPQQTQGSYIMIIVLAVLIFPGVIVNNLTSSGLISSSSAMTCTDPGSPTCTLSANVGCQANPANCDLAGNSFSFLNANSPFTQLLSGNIFGFFGALTSSGSSGTTYNGDVATPVFGQGPFDALGGNSYVNGLCTIYPIGGGRLGFMDYNMTGCTQTSPAQNTNITASSALNMTNYNTVKAAGSSPYPSDGVYDLALSQVYNNAVPYPDPIPPYTDASILTVGCSWQGEYNFTTTGTGRSATSTGWVWYGCQATINGWISPPSDPLWSFMVAIPESTGLISNGFNQVAVYIQPEQWSAAFCLLSYSDGTAYPEYASQSCLTFENNVNPNVVAFSSSSLGGLTLVLGFIVGLVLFLIGLGISVNAGGSVLATGTSAGVGTNMQGTRLAQIVGLGLLIWTPLYSEFSTWFASGFLGFGLDAIIGVALTTAFAISLFLLLFVGSHT
jgi:hypothetical protein